MSRFLRREDVPTAARPALYDSPPPRSASVLPERDPGTGRLLDGDPTGRGDKGRTGSPRRVGATLAAAAGAVVVAGAVVGVVVLGGDRPAPSAAADQAETSAPVAAGSPAAAPSTSAAPPPPAVTGPRTVPITLTTVAIRTPPGFPEDPSFGVAGEVRPRSWVLTGPCDGSGPCTIQHCADPATCQEPLDATPDGVGGYVGSRTGPVQWRSPACTGGTITATVTFRVSGPPETPRIVGNWVESADPVVVPGPNLCGIYLGSFAIRSS